MPNRSWDEDRLRDTIEVARFARDHGNHPFGALLTDQSGLVLLTAENSVVTDRDCTAHAETSLVREACKGFDSKFLLTCTIYASSEPCPMCAGGIYWLNVRRVVFGLSQEKLYTLTGDDEHDVLYLPCRDVFAKGGKSIEVIGPLLEDEALEVHMGFWK